MKKISIKLLISILFSILILSITNPSTDVLAKGKSVKQEVIHNRKQLINSFTKHIINLDKNFSYKISKKALKNFGKDFDKLWDEFTDSPSYNEIFKYSDITYKYSKKGSFLYLDGKISYKISKEKAKKLLKNLDKTIVKDRKTLLKKYSSHILNLDKNFKFNVSKKLLAYSYDDIDDFRTELAKNPAYNDIMEYCEIDEEFYEYKNYWEWILTPKYKISKDKAKSVLKQVSPVLNTKEELLDKMTRHVSNLDKSFSLNIKNEILNFDSERDYKELWESLYHIPEFNDIDSYGIFDSSFNSYNGYIKWTVKYDYDISKKEVDELNTFVRTWVRTNINSSMTEEEKVRTINDFMVREYRYTFGDRGELSGDQHGTEKIGKYSVYSSFALLYEKGGVCDSKAKMFYRLAKEAGLEVIYITGNVSSGLHAWNMVKVDGKWYHIDPTWNRGQYEGDSEYQYFNDRSYYLKGDATMSNTHTWERAKYPGAFEDYPSHNLLSMVSDKVYMSRKMAA